MKRYGIADYLTLKQRRAIATAQYSNVGRTYKQRLTAEGCCPMGVLGLDYIVSPSAPDGETVALTLLRHIDMGERVEMDEDAWLARVTALAQEFIDDWDDGKIAPRELSTALGLVQP